jgi:hypothetical protein
MDRIQRKNQWNSQRYDRITLIVKTGDRDKLKAAAKAEGHDSVNRLVIGCINEKYPGLISLLDDTSKQKKDR